MTMTMAEIARLARDYSDAAGELEETVDEVREDQRAAARARMRSIKARAAKASAAKDALAEAVEANRHLFDKPRTQSAHGVKFGLRKQPGRLAGDAEAAIARIESTMPGKAGALVRTKKELIKAALLELPAAELAKLGISVEASGDKVVVQAARGDLDRLVEALMEDAGAAP